MFEGNLQGITFNEGDNLGGARGMRFVPVEWVQAWAPAIQGVVPGTINLITDKEWISWRATEDTADFQENETQGDGGPIYEQNYKQSVAGDTIDQRMEMDSGSRHEVIVEVVDNNGVVRRLGDQASPAVLVVSYGTGGTTAARNAWTVTINATARRPAPVVLASPSDYTLELPPE